MEKSDKLFVAQLIQKFPALEKSWSKTSANPHENQTLLLKAPNGASRID
jgi:hypothetical protein